MLISRRLLKGDANKSTINIFLIFRFTFIFLVILSLQFQLQLTRKHQTKVHNTRSLQIEIFVIFILLN